MIPGLSGSGVKLGNFRKRAGSDPRAVERNAGETPSMAAVLRELGALHTALSRQALPPTLMEQAFRQLTHLLSASALNSLLLHKDMCSWSRGLQIRSEDRHTHMHVYTHRACAVSLKDMQPDV